ncbi:MAG: hypothetical protein ACE5JS_04595 [Nitrospinota bacterium]
MKNGSKASLRFGEAGHTWDAGGDNQRHPGSPKGGWRPRHGIMWLFAVALLLTPGTGQAATDLVPLSRPGIWPGISGVIGYRGRLWFVNSVKFVNHNSADIYSYDPATGVTSYERSLLSQDAGDPVVAGGLLYWPFEDPRSSAGRGEFMVTNGRDWAWRTMSEGVSFHVHAIVAHGGVLFAATSAWRAGLQESQDGGATWTVLYDHETPKGKVSRITSLAILDGVLYAGLTAFYREDIKLLRMRSGGIAPVPGWPSGHGTVALTEFRGWLYGVNWSAEDIAVWRTDGLRVERVTGLDGRQVRDFAADGGAIWAISVRKGSGTLWRSGDGVSWSAEFRFKESEPLEVATYGGRTYVGTLNPRGGTLWGPQMKPRPRPAGPMAPLPGRSPRLSGIRMRQALDALDRALADPSSYRRHGTRLRRALEPFALAGGEKAGAELSRRLAAQVPRLNLSLFGGALGTTSAEMARWYLLRAMALTGHGHVPTALLTIPWTEPKNRAEKYFHPVPAAAWAVAQLGQADDATVESLIVRLSQDGDPPWLAGDIVNALTVLTGKRFGHDKTAWLAWWEKKKRAESSR